MAISPRQFAALQQRLEGRGKNGNVHERIRESTAPFTGVVLGVDPSLRGTGWGVVRFGRPQHQALAFGTIRCPARWERSRCLLHILQTLREVTRQHGIGVCAIEGLFFAQNIQTALIMGEARGAALAAIAESGVPIFEIAPRKVKQAVVGFGGAQKSAVAKMVQRMLNLPTIPDADAADALALALTYLQESGRHSLASPKQV